MEVCQGLSTAFVVFDESSEAGGPGEGSFDDPSSGQQHETALGLRQFDDLERNAVFSGGGRWLLAGVALIDESDLHALSGLRLNGLGDTADFGPIIRVGGRDMQSQKMAKRVDGQWSFDPLFAFGAVISGASATLRGRAQGPAVEDDGGWQLAPARCKTQDDAQVLSQSLEASRLQPIAAPAGRRSPMAAGRSASSGTSTSRNPQNLQLISS